MGIVYSAVLLVAVMAAVGRHLLSPAPSDRSKWAVGGLIAVALLMSSSVPLLAAATLGAVGVYCVFHAEVSSVLDRSDSF